MLEINKIYNMDCREGLKLLEDNSIDSIVTDPPYELGFMGKKWDSTGIAYNVDLWREALRVLKPGGHLLAFGGTRTYHRMACAIEDAGFEIRDCMQWIYGSGFPKSMDISKAIDKASGAEREVIGKQPYTSQNIKGNAYESEIARQRERIEVEITAPATEAAKQWQGWGTALKPANEPIVVARKPISGTVAENILKWGTGGINIDDSRIGTDIMESGGSIPDIRNNNYQNSTGKARLETEIAEKIGRWPANVIFDQEAAEMLDKQSGDRKAGGKVNGSEPSTTGQNGIYGHYNRVENQPFNDFGGASRFFYCAKASQGERNFGCEDMPDREIYPQNNSVSRKEINANKDHKTKNFHPTVKPLKLIEYLITLVTPRGGVCLDLFEGSGTHQRACIALGFNYIGFEIDPQYFEIAESRSHEVQLKLF
jgi:DNA modification methylase